MRAAAIAAAVVAAFVGVMYLRFASDSVPGPPPGSAVGGPQCVVARTATEDGPDDQPAEPTCGPNYAYDPFPYEPAPIVERLPTPVPTTAPFLSGMTILPLELGPPRDLPADVALILETGCWGCEGGPAGLVRVYARPDGSVAYDSLLDPAKLGLPMLKYTAPDGSVNEFPPRITGYAITPDASEIVAGICVRGTCAPEGLDSWSPDSQTALFRSSDGGISWAEIGRLEVGASVFGLLPTGEVLLTTYDSRESTKTRIYPSFNELPVPPDTNYYRPDVLPNGDLVWRTQDGTPIRSDGRPFLSVPLGAQAWISDFLVSNNGTEGVAIAGGYSDRGTYTYYVLPFDSSGLIGRGEFAQGGESVVWMGGPEHLAAQIPGERLLLGSASVPTAEIAPNGQPYVSQFVPVMLDLDRAVMQPFRPFMEGIVPRSRNLVAAAQRGPFARVVNTDNTCLNVRAEPLPSAGILDCAAEGVLLRDLGEPTDLAGSTWLHVSTPARSVGWANAAYLER